MKGRGEFLLTMCKGFSSSRNLQFYFSLFFSYSDLLRLFRLFKRVQGKNNDVLMDWLKMVHDRMRRYFPEEVTKMENCEDATTYFEVWGVFLCEFF